MPVVVLLVDNDSAFLADAEHALTEAGLRVLTANRGRSALAAVRSIPEITLVVLELDLRDIPGMALIGDLREARPDLKIIAMTAVLCQPVLESAVYFGAETTLRKPFTGEWIAAINNVNHRARAGGVRSGGS